MDPLGRDRSLAAELDIEEAELIGHPCCHWGRESVAVLAAIRYRGRVKAAFRKTCVLVLQP
jgi:putative heme degradation protein